MTVEDVADATLGWVGAGRMGAAMAARLLDAGRQLTIFNRTPSKLAPLLAMGARKASTVAELSLKDIVFVNVSSSDDLLAVTLGDGGLLRQEVAPSVIVDTSTVSADASAELRARGGERGCALLAAPVSGNPKVASAGRLTLSVSGPRASFDLVSPLFHELGAGATWVGEGELARLVKLCHNLFLGVVTQSLAEVTILAEKGGVKRAAFLEYLNRSVMGSTFTRYKAPALVNLDYHATFTSRLLHKDFDLGLQAASDFEVPMPVASLVAQIIETLVNEGYGDEDFAALIALQARAAGIAIESENTDVPDGLSAL
jgi:3-hydroxyisobutyrate dehydrogenase-like beta-hydroxyacid dehydrogenase